MRSTIRVFIKTELKKRETSRAKQTKDVAPATPITPVEALGDHSQATVTEGMAAVVVGETQGTGGTSSLSQKTVDNALSGAEDSQMQETGPADARQEDATDNSHDRGGVGDNGKDAGTGPTHESVRNNCSPFLHFVRSHMSSFGVSGMLLENCPMWTLCDDQIC